MGHDARSGCELIGQFDKSKVLWGKHTSIKSQFWYRGGNSGKRRSYNTFHFTASHLCIHHVVIHGVKSQQIGCHLAVEREGRTISGCRTEWISVRDFPGCKQHLQVVGQALGISAKPEPERRWHGNLQMGVAGQQNMFVFFALLNQHLKKRRNSIYRFFYFSPGIKLQVYQHLVIAWTAAVNFFAHITQFARKHQFYLRMYIFYSFFNNKIIIYSQLVDIFQFPQ